MTKKRAIITCMLGMAIIFGIANIKQLSAGETKPGSSLDPVVTKSYVDGLIKEVKNSVNGTGNTGSSTSTNSEALTQKLKAQEEIIGMLSSQVNALQNSVESLKNGTAGDTIYEVVEVPAGKKLIGKQGSEVILRAGEGKAISSAGGGLQDMTQGKDIVTGNIPKYHLLIIPRSDGRGILVTQKAVFMVRGGYTLE